jgi:hypothetical protein
MPLVVAGTMGDTRWPQQQGREAEVGEVVSQVD